MICHNALFNHKGFININNFNGVILTPCHQIFIILPTKSIDPTVYLNALSWFEFGRFHLLFFQFSFKLCAEIWNTFFWEFPYLNTWKLFVFSFYISFDEISWCRSKNSIWNWVLCQSVPAVNLVRKILGNRCYHFHFVFFGYFQNFHVWVWLFTTGNYIFFT